MVEKVSLKGMRKMAYLTNRLWRKSQNTGISDKNSNNLVEFNQVV